MPKWFIGATLLALTLFGVGYIVGQVKGVSTGFAAGGVPVVPNSATGGRGGAFQYAASDAAPAAVAAKHSDGTVSAINGTTITVNPDNDANNPNEYNSVTAVVVTGSTQYGPGGKTAIKVGSHIFAEGTVSSDGKTLTATQVSAGRTGGCPHGAHGGSPPSNAPSNATAFGANL